MTTIIDPELTVRLGSLDPDRVERIQDYATASFLWRGLAQADALDVSRALHWSAVGREPTAPAVDVITTLALSPLTAAQRDRLVTLLDVQWQADNGRERPLQAESRSFTCTEYARLGRRIAHALALLGTVEHAAA